MTNHLRDVLVDAQSNAVAVGHFNIADGVFLKAVAAAAREMKLPVIVGASEGERSFLGTAQLAALVKSLREEQDLPIFLNADHTHSLDSAMAAAKAGFDSIVFDLSQLPFEENIRQTKQAIEALKSINPDILVEGEIGDIGSGSEIHESEPDHPTALTTPEEAKYFVENTGVDILAPAIGNRHGMLRAMVKGNAKKRIDLVRTREIKNATRSFLTLHGGSGTDDSDLQNVVSAGINIVHINTELRVAWRHSLEQALAGSPGEVVPYKLLPAVQQAIAQVVSSRLRLFGKRTTHAMAQ